MRAVLFEGEPVCVKVTCYVIIAVLFEGQFDRLKKTCDAIRAVFLKKAWLCENVT